MSQSKKTSKKEEKTAAAVSQIAVEAEVAKVVVGTDGAEGLNNSSSLAESSNVGLKRGAEEGISIIKFNLCV